MPRPETSAPHPLHREELAFLGRMVAGAREELWIGQTGNDRYSRDSHADSKIVQRTDAILDVIGIDPARWVDHFTNISPRLGIFERFDSEKRTLANSFVPLGRYLLDRCYWELDIEGQEDGDASVSVYLELPEQKQALFSAQGSHWMDYVFSTIAADDERSLDELMEDGIEPTSSEVGYRIEITVEIESAHDQD